MESPITQAVKLLKEASPFSQNSCLWTC